MRISKSMKGRGFTSIDVQSVINRFILVIFIMQWLIDKNLSCFPSKRGNQQSTILIILSTAVAIIRRTKSYEISTVSIHSVVKLNFNHHSVCLCYAVSHPVKWYHVTFFYWCHWRGISRCIKSKSKCGLYFVSWYDIVLYFCQTNKCHIYEMPLRSSYFVSIVL